MSDDPDKIIERDPTHPLPTTSNRPCKTEGHGPAKFGDSTTCIGDHDTDAKIRNSCTCRTRRFRS